MIISRTPFRISFFGGGTDYPTWSEAHGGADQLQAPLALHERVERLTV